jgi:hypothetical protein
MGFISDLFGATNKYRVNEGLPTGFQNTNYAQALKQAMGGMQTPQFDPTMANQTAGQQDALIAALNQQLTGGAPSVAQQQLNQSLNQNQASTASAIGSTRGMNPAAAARLILQTQAGQAQDAAGQGALLRANEIGNVQNALGSVLANKRASDIGQASNAAEIGLQGLNTQTNRIGTLGNLQNTNNANVLQNKLGSAQINSGVAQQNAATAGAIGSGLLGSIASAIIPVPKKMAEGGEVPGLAEVPGDSYANDKVPAMLSPGEIVIPRSHTTPDRAKEFVQAIKSAKPEDRKKKKVDFSDVLSSQRRLEERLGRIEYMACGGMVKR